MLENLFALQVTDTGIRYFKRLQAIAPFLFTVAVFASVFGFLYSLGWIKSLLRLAEVNSRYTIVAYTLGAYNFLIVVLLFLEAWFFWRFSRLNKKTMVASDAEGFNASFRWLVMAIICFLIILVVNLIYLLIIVYFQFVLRIL